MSQDTMRLTDMSTGAHIDIYRTQWPYKTEIHAPICISQASDGTYPDNGFFDPGLEYDYRILNMSALMLPASQKINLNAFLNSVSQGRCENFILDLGIDSTGFYPFGIDIGDAGTFIVRVISRTQSGMKTDPWKWFTDEISMVLIDSTGAGSTEGLVGRNEGVFYIGDIENGFIMPDDGYEPESNYNFSTGITVSGVPHSIDNPKSSDYYTTKFTLSSNAYATNELITQLMTSTRTADIILRAPDSFCMFGVDLIGHAGNYTCKFLGSSKTDKEVVLIIKHIHYDRFETELTFWCKAAS